MHRSLVVVGALGMLLGCRFQDSVPTDVRITCDDGVCPKGMRCNRAINRCLDEAAFDDTPPAIEPGTLSVALFAPPGSPLSDVTALGPAGQATLVFSVTEPLGALPRPLPDDALSCSTTQRSQLGYAMTCALAAGVTGRRTVMASVELVDVVGNSAEVVVSALELDADRPAPPNTDTPQVLTLVREPWGTAASQGAPRQLLRAVAGAAEASTRLVVTDATGALVLARTDVDATGGFGDLPLSSPTEDVFVRVVDTAGNTSDVRRVRDRSVASSLFGVIPRSPSSSPHGLTTYEVHGGSVIRTDGVARGEADLAAMPDASVLVRGGYGWTKQWLDVPLGYDQRPGFVSDELGARLVRFGGRNGQLARRFSRLYELRSGSWHELAEEDLESDGSPGDRGMTAMAWDTFRHEAVLFGGVVSLPGALRSGVSGDTWTLAGRSWRRHDVPGPAPRFGHTLAWDRARRQAVLVGGLSADGGLYDDTWAWNGVRWTQLDAGTPGGVFDGALAWSPTLGGLILAAGRDVNPRSSTWLFDGVAWRQLDAGVGPGGSASAAWDARRETMVVATNALQTWELSGGRWSRVADVPGTTERVPALAWDGARGLVVAAGAGSTNECDALGMNCRDVIVPTLTWDGVQWRAQGQRVPFVVGPLPFATAGALGGLLSAPGEGVTWMWRDQQWSRRLDVDSPDAACLLTATSDGGVAYVNAGGTFAHDGTGWARIGGALPAGQPLSSFVEVGGALWLNAGTQAYRLGADGGWSAGGAAGTNGTATALPNGLALYTGSSMPLTQGQYSVLAPAPDGGLTRASLGVAAKVLGALTWDPLRQQVVSFSGFPTLTMPASPELTVGRPDAGFEVVAVSDPYGTGLPRGRAGASFAFDPSSKELVLSAGFDLGEDINDSWQLASFGTRPSAVMRVDLNALALPTDAVVTGLHVEGRAGATGFDGGAALDGVQLQLFREGAWWDVPGARSTARVSAPAALSTTLTDARALSAVFDGQASLWLALVPLGTTGVEAAELRTGALEVTVSYRVP